MEVVDDGEDSGDSFKTSEASDCVQSALVGALGTVEVMEGGEEGSHASCRVRCRDRLGLQRLGKGE